MSFGPYYDMDGCPITEEESSEYYKGDNNRVAYTVLPEGGHVSTIFLVHDHNFGMGHKPVLFESICFGPKNEERECLRYSTKQEAEVGHDSMVDRHLKRQNALIRAAKCNGLKLSGNLKLLKKEIDKLKESTKPSIQVNTPITIDSLPAFFGMDVATSEGIPPDKAYSFSGTVSGMAKSLWLSPTLMELLSKEDVKSKYTAEALKLKAEEEEAKLKAKMEKVLSMPNQYIAKWSWDDL